MSPQPYGSAARAYFAAGYWPLPLPPRKKASPPEGYTGRNGRDVCAADVDGWLAEHRSGNIGLRLPRGVAGIDVDAYKDDDHAAAWAELIASCGSLPDAPWCSSRDDGVSGIRLFRVPARWEAAGKLPEGANGVSPGEVIQWHHRYVVCPPSIHPDTGRAYRWRAGSITKAADLPELPQSWLEALSAATAPAIPARPSATPRGTDQAGDRPGDDFNERADWLADILSPHGWELHHEAGSTLYVTRPGKSRRDGHSATIGHSNDDADRLYVFSADAEPFEMEKPYTKFSAYALLNHGGDHRAAARELGRLGYGRQSGGDSHRRLSPPLSPAKSGPDQHERPAGDNGDTGDRGMVSPRSPRRVTWTAPELIAAEFPEPTWAVPGIVTNGLTLLVGAPKAGKSWLAYGTAVAIASGGRALGSIEVKQGDCLYLALEDTGRRMQARLAKILVGADAPQALTVTIACDDAPAYIRGWIREHKGARLVIIDVLARVRAPAVQDESRYDADYRLLAAIKAVADATGVPFLVLHHTRKMGSGDFVDEVSGTQGIAGAADAILVLRRMRGEAGGLLQVTGRDIEEADYALTFAAEIGAWQLSDIPADEVLLGGTRAAVLRYLKEHEGSGPTEIAKGTGISMATVKQTVRRMVTDAQLETDGKGRYWAPVTGGDV